MTPRARARAQAEPHLHWPPGLHRKRGGKWVDEDGAAVTDAATLTRLDELAIPPAWHNVWAAIDPDERVQARGVDSRGRVQYRYSAAAVEEASHNKYSDMLHYASVLPHLRDLVSRHLDRREDEPDLDQVTALVGRFLDLGLFRIGSDRYVKDNNTYGLTTLQARHVDVDGDTVEFDFVGKEHIQQVHHIRDKAAARLTKQLLKLRASDKEEFLFIATNPTLRRVRAATLNSFIHKATGAAASAKMARTWGGTVIATAVAAGARFDGGKKRRDPELVAYDAASHVLGNTPNMARKSYVHPSSWPIGRYPSVQEALEEACERQGTDDATKVFVDTDFQEAVRRGIVMHKSRQK